MTPVCIPAAGNFQTFHHTWNHITPHPRQLEMPAPIEACHPWTYRLSKELHEWLIDHGQDYAWKYIERPARINDRPILRRLPAFLIILIPDPKVAMLFKLTWGGQ